MGKKSRLYFLLPYSPLPIPHSPITMIIGRIIGNVVATRKDPRLEGKKLLLVRPITLTGEDESSYLVAVDTVGAGYREKVLVVSGSSARMADGLKDRPVDAAIVGIIDTVEVTD
ncbi:MAG TPA: EutN/CcmL family microcompartment protein [Blastocatellia bacterium]|nr:EutN/CcmL family microcompartment protein [Blastocatellia bacterium]